MSERRILDRILVDGSGNEVRVRVEIDEGGALEREIAHLANRLRSNRKQKVASSAHGVIRVWMADEAGK